MSADQVLTGISAFFTTGTSSEHVERCTGKIGLLSVSAGPAHTHRIASQLLAEVDTLPGFVH